MKKIESLEMAEVLGGVNCGKNYDFWNGFLCTATVVLAFTPAAPLALATGNGCLIMAAGHLGGCKA